MKIFSHPVWGKVRTIIVDGEVWFIGRDIASHWYSNPNMLIKVLCRNFVKRKVREVSHNVAVLTIDFDDVKRIAADQRRTDGDELIRWIEGEVIPQTLGASPSVKEGQIEPLQDVQDIHVIECNGERVLTTKQLAAVYGCSVDNIRSNVKYNKDWFAEGVHFYRLEGLNLQAFKRDVRNSHVVPENANSITLWTKRGAVRHCKMLGTKFAFEVFDKLESFYFERDTQKFNLPNFLDPVEAARAWADAEEQKQLAEKKLMIAEKSVEEMKPKARFADAVVASDSSILVGELAKLIQQNGHDIGEKRFFKWLRGNGYLINRYTDKNMPTQKSMEMGLFEIHERTITKPDGTELVKRTPKVTGKGQLYFVNKFCGKG